MLGEWQLPFEEMKLKQLKEELAARSARRSGLKAMLQHQLHGLLVQAAIEAQAGEEAEAASKRPAGPGSTPTKGAGKKKVRR